MTYDTTENATKKPRQQSELKPAAERERHGGIATAKSSAEVRPKSRVHTIVFEDGLFVIKDSLKKQR